MLSALLFPLKKIKLFLIIVFVQLNNLIFFRKKAIRTNIVELQEILKRSRCRTDFSDHLATVFIEGMLHAPQTIVELGTRGGESTFVFSRVAKLIQAHFISVDLEDCSGSSDYPDWIFVQKDDIEFAKNYPRWCQERKLKSEIDLLYIDTSHLYEHTTEEIKSWFPYLSDDAMVIFHDTNLQYIFKRRDGSLGISGWDNKRGVIRALEDYMGKKYNEKKEFVDIQKGWLIRHWPNCSGLTILNKIKS